MSLASLFNSFDPAAQFGSVTAGSVVSTASLTVKGVPITGLLSSGAPESAYSGQTFVQTLGSVSVDGLYGSSTLELETNSATRLATFEDVVSVDASGSWTYSYPAPFIAPPILELIAAAGSAGPLLDSYDLSGASGFLRYATSQSKFVIRGAGSYIPATAGFIVPPSLNPSAVLTTALPGSSGGTVLRVQQFGTLITPADLDPTKVCVVTASWAPVSAWTPTATYHVVLLFSTAPITTLLQPSVNVGGFVGVPSGAVTSDFASQPWNQYQSTSVKLLPNTQYYVSMLWDGGVPATNQSVQTKIDLQSVTYYPTGLLTAVPAPAEASAAAVPSGHALPMARRRVVSEM